MNTSALSKIPESSDGDYPSPAERATRAQRWIAYGVTWAAFLAICTAVMAALSFLMEK